MKKVLLLCLLISLLAAPSPFAEETDKKTSAKQSPGFLHRLLLYIPNRILDTLDLVRLRLRVGPGFAAGVRVTETADAFVGGYASVFAGLPGPRYPGKLRLPVGLEAYGGAEFSLIDITNEETLGPDYSPTEIGVNLHLGIVGVDAGFDPMEIVDWLAGFLTLDLRGDDF